MNYILAALLLLAVSLSSLLPGNHKAQKTKRVGMAKVVFKSTDGGRSWQDISMGLPQDLQLDSIRANSIVANDKGLILRVGNGLYQHATDATTSFWTKISPDGYSNIAAGKSGTVATHYWGVHLKKANGRSVWSPIFDNSSEQRIRSVFETAGGAIFIGTDKGIFKTADDGKTWKHVHAEGWAGNMAESNGVLVSTSKQRLIRSTDNGEHWERVMSGDSVAFDVKQTNGGFVAITSNSKTNSPTTSKLSTSNNGGKTWQHIDAERQGRLLRTWNDRPFIPRFTTSIIEVGENFLCIDREGIYRSLDKGKTWTFLLPSVGDKTFSVFVSGNAIYAIPVMGGC